MRQAIVYPVFCIIFMVLSIMGFILIDLSTFEPSQISGNGNIAILFVIPSVIFYLLFLFYLSRWSIDALNEMKFPNRIFLLLSLLIALTLLIFLEVDFYRNLLHLLGGGPDNPESRIYRFGWFNQYTNTIYFNWITFCMGMLLSTLNCLSYTFLGKTRK